MMTFLSSSSSPQHKSHESTHTKVTLCICETGKYDLLIGGTGMQSSRSCGSVSRGEEEGQIRTPQFDAYFTPVAIGTSGVFGPQSETFIKDLRRRLA